VVHFAAESHVDRSIAAAAAFATTNVVGTQVLLDAALRHGVGRFVHVSTDEVYGSIAAGAWSERSPVSPNSPYAATKAGSDLLALAYHRTHGLPVVVTRSANNYGPYQHPEKLIPRFVTNLLEGRTVPLYGDGSQIRDWVHVDDHCRGVALALLDGRAGEVYHIGGTTELSNRQLTERLLHACGAGWDRVVTVADRKGHDQRYALDDDRIRRELGYRPRVDFGDGLAATVQWYRDNRDWWRPLVVD
jgi:dTDP-glucose 4,6-dehydratase